MRAKKTSNIPSFHEMFDQISRYLVKYRVLSVLFVDCSELEMFERWYGKKTYTDVKRVLKKVIGGMKGSYIRKNDIITTNRPNDEQFFIFLSQKREDKKFSSLDLEKLTERIGHYLNEEVSKKTAFLIKGTPQIYIGHAIVIYNPIISTENLLNRLMEDAKKMAEYQKFRDLIRNKEKVQELIYKEEISTVYQPILNISTGKILGYEALTRGPKGSEYENPFQLFKAASEVDLDLELDCICKKHAFLNAQNLPKGMKIFINCLPRSLKDPEFKTSELKKLLKGSKIVPANLIFEITEREAIESYHNFKELLQYYTKQGIAIAVDDAGAGYSNFESLIELQPNYIKIDISLIRDINESSLKQEMIRALINISKDIKAVAIAEGVETDEEYHILKKLGVVYAQGYLFAKPAFPFPSITPPYNKKK